MSNNYITNTSSSGLHLVSHQGVAVCHCYRQIQDLLRKRLGGDAAAPDVAELFAEPVINQGDTSIDWYTGLAGRAVPLSTLPEEEQRAVRARFDGMVASVNQIAGELLAQEDNAARVKGNILQKALIWPDDNSIYVCNGQPVIVGWGFSGKGLNAVQAADIDRQTALRAAAVAASTAMPETQPEPIAQPVQPQPVPEKKKGFGWWPLLLLIPLLLLLLWLLSRCTPADNGATNMPPSAPVAETAPEPEKPADIATPPLVPVENVPDKVVDGVKPDETLVVPAEVPTEVPAVVTPEVSQEMPAEVPGEPLRIPEQADNVSFMRGVVRVVTPMVNEAGHNVTLRVVLDEKGEGTAYIDGREQTCQGPARATYQPGEVRVATESLQCPNGNNFEPIVMLCHGQGELSCGLENKGKLLPVRASKQDVQ